MTEDSVDGIRKQDGGHEPEAPTARRTLEHVDLETALHELSPGAIVRSADFLRGEADDGRSKWGQPKSTTSRRHLAFGASTP